MSLTGYLTASLPRIQTCKLPKKSDKSHVIIKSGNSQSTVHD